MKTKKKPPYYRQQLFFKNEECEILLVTWPPGSKSEIHDHGQSKGIITVLTGHVFQDIYSQKTKRLLLSKIHTAGKVIKEYPDTLHRMGNASKSKIAVTTHIYWPPLDAMRCYNLKNGQSWIVRREDFSDGSRNKK